MSLVSLFQKTLLTAPEKQTIQPEDPFEDIPLLSCDFKYEQSNSDYGV
jgi:hypothetical protein